jgi:hypothetical protein
MKLVRCVRFDAPYSPRSRAESGRQSQTGAIFPISGKSGGDKRRRSSRAKRRASRICNRMGEPARRCLRHASRRDISAGHANAHRSNDRRSDHRVMRPSEAEDAVIAAGIRPVHGRYRRALRIMRAQDERRGAGIGMREGGESAERDEQALRGNGVGGDNGDQRSPKSSRSYAQSKHHAAHPPPQSWKPRTRKSTSHSGTAAKSAAAITVGRRFQGAGSTANSPSAAITAS